MEKSNAYYCLSEFSRRHAWGEDMRGSFANLPPSKQ
jgi:hypothetical protein